MKKYDVEAQRALFPALEHGVIFFDGPGGTQMPASVIEAMSHYMLSGTTNLAKNPHKIYENTHDIVRRTRENAAAFVNAESPSEIVFGANATSLIAHFSRSIAREWGKGDEIIVTALDHGSNVSFWKAEAKYMGVNVNVLRVNPEDGSIDENHFYELMNKNPVFIACGLASNVTGTLSQVHRITSAAKAIGATTFIDAVHYAAHFTIDVQDLDCDYLVCSPYKFYGPHSGFLYGKTEHLGRLTPFKVEPAVDTIPDCWETGTKSFETLAGVNTAFKYIASMGEGDTMRERLVSAYQNAIIPHETSLSRYFLERAAHVKGLKIYGITDLERLHQRTATFAMTLEGSKPQKIVDRMAARGILVGGGSFYGNLMTDALGKTDEGGVVRAGFMHYNTKEEIQRFIEALKF
ncbi:MAG: cysteine desulfurase-like protein [Alphaproteobacteria bacterium]